MGAHLIDGQFQSDKYPTTPRGKVPLSVRDPEAQGLLWEYAQRRRKVDAEFSDDLEAALLEAGYAPRHEARRAAVYSEEADEAWRRGDRTETLRCLRMAAQHVHAAQAAVLVADGAPKA